MPRDQIRRLITLLTKKLREADFFLRQIETAARPRLLNSEELEFLLSAFLSASGSIPALLESRAHGKWLDDWTSGRTARERELLQFMRRQRNVEVHGDGAAVSVAWEFVPVTSFRTEAGRHPAYGVTWWGPPGAPPPAVGVKVHRFNFGTTQATVGDTCAEFGRVLRDLVTDFARDHSAAPGQVQGALP